MSAEPAGDVADLTRFIDASPSPYHAVATARALLDAAGFAALDAGGAWTAGDVEGPAYVARDGALVAWVPGGDRDPGAPMRLIGAHTDSPGLRIRPRPDRGVGGWRQLGIEVYGGALRNSWLDRDLGLAGRVAVRRTDPERPGSGSDGTDGTEHRAFRTAGAVMRVPQLAIHLDREISTEGLSLNPQQHLTPVWGLGEAHEGDFRTWLADQVGVHDDDVVAWEAMAFDVQPAAVIGAHGDLLAAPRLDDQACCWGALAALVAVAAGAAPPAVTSVVVLNDHEEIGSTTATGADGAWLEQVLERRAAAQGGTRADLLRSLAGSMLLSADMAHATHPNYPERHEPGHWIRAGGGPVVKHNVNARYATDSGSAAAFRAVCRSAGVAVQDYSHRGDLPCGSTIGPLTAARLAVDTVDVGMPMLSMHSARELMAVADVTPMRTAFTAWFTAT
ncbi:M18 family aminopeptidase [Dermatobacter hominis]|uniref:M18 family aminopeptidase n=1 Tax=Dermatobacter hominis TaxID=2884263 RepID=UPI001D129BCD|nr:M18 family aminopeptidase [Dermatobacter hominis]UDY36485.1 M18 family aminopeptidase [Dermatobacter hominis]